MPARLVCEPMFFNNAQRVIPCRVVSEVKDVVKSLPSIPRGGPQKVIVERFVGRRWICAQPVFKNDAFPDKWDLWKEVFPLEVQGWATWAEAYYWLRMEAAFRAGGKGGDARYHPITGAMILFYTYGFGPRTCPEKSVRKSLDESEGRWKSVLTVPICVFVAQVEGEG